MILEVLKEKSIDPITALGVPGLYLYLNPVTYLSYRRSYSKLFAVQGLRYDGLLFGLMNKVFLGMSFPRRSFDLTSMAGDVFSYLQAYKINVAIYGGSAQDIRGFLQFLKTEYPELVVSDWAPGYNFDVRQCKLVGVGFVLVGMGGVLQDDVAATIHALAPEAQVMTCGAFITQTARSGGAYYPKFFDSLNLRFLYRFYREPRVFIRVLIGYPIFLFCYLFDFCALKLGRFF